jgi:hypothetical protein
LHSIFCHEKNSVFVLQFGYEIVYVEEIEAMGEVCSTKPKFDDSKSKCCESCLYFNMFLDENMLLNG